MFSGIRRLIGRVKVVERDGEIRVSGIPADVMSRDISKFWRTSRINNHMFSKVGRDGFSFPSFFAPDIVYMLGELTQYRSRQTSVRMLARIKQELLTNTWLANTEQDESVERLDLNRLQHMAWTPLDFQLEYLKSYSRLTNQYSLKGYLLAGAPGSGKTYLGLALGECLNADRIVVISPKNATERVWEANITSVFKKPQSYWIYQQGKPYQGERIAVFHYEALGHALQMVEQLKAKRLCVILDESHNLNELNSLRTRHFIDLCRQLESENTVWASGTPIKAMGAEMIPMLHTIDPYFNDEVEKRFRAIYGRDGNRGLDILQHRMGLISFKIEKHELKLDKPIIRTLDVAIPEGKDYTLTAIRRDMREYIEQRVKYYQARRKEDQQFFDECQKLHKTTLRSQPQKEAYKQYRANLRRVIDVGDIRQVSDEIRACNQYELQVLIPSLPQDRRHAFKDVRSVIKYVQLKIQGEALGRVLGRKRIECHVKLVPHVDFKGVLESTEKKTVVFTSFVEVVETAVTHLQREGFVPLSVYGKTNRELNQTITQFDKKEDINPLIATYDSLSTAVPLVMADTMIMLNDPFRAYIQEQAISRIHRLGADTQTIVYRVVLDTGQEPNISTRSADILQWSRDQVEAIMGFSTPFEIEGLGVEAWEDPQQTQGLLNTLYAPYGIELRVDEPVEVPRALPPYTLW